MSAIREPGKINPNTTLIDIGAEVKGMTAVYLVQDAKTCLIDGGTKEDAPNIVKQLKALGAFPPDKILITHPHFDHAQGIPILRAEAAELGKEIEVIASQDAIPLLADAAFNDVFGNIPHASITGVTPVKEGDTIDLGGLTLRTYELPGHCQGHIAVLDENNHNIFVGDSIGYKFSDDLFLAAFMPPTWDTAAFMNSVDKLKQVPYETLCLAHFGCIYGSEAREILDQAVEVFNAWWQFYERHADRLDDVDFLLQSMRKEINPGIPKMKIASLKLKLMFGFMNAMGSITGKKTAINDKLTFGELMGWLATGYKMYSAAH